MRLNPIIVPDTHYQVTLTNGKIFKGLSSKITDRGFFLDATEIFFGEIHDFKFFPESLGEYLKRKEA